MYVYPVPVFSGVRSPVLTVGQIKEGEVPGFSSITLELLYSPLLPTKDTRDFVVTFDHPSLPPVSYWTYTL